MRNAFNSFSLCVGCRDSYLDDADRNIRPLVKNYRELSVFGTERFVLRV